MTDQEFTYYLTVDHVYDGDTIMGVLDMGLGLYLGKPGGPLWSVRLYGINAPELKSGTTSSRAAGRAARDFLAAMAPVGETFQVVSKGWDKYGGRLDGIVYAEDGTSMNDRMLEAGHAAVYE